jgi:hypothetical protein
VHLFTDTPQLGNNRAFSFIHALNPVTHSSLYRTDIPNHAMKPLWFNGRGLIASPHGPIHRDMAFDNAGSERYSRNGGL